MRNALGYGLWSEPGKADIERDTVTCCHCNGVFFVKPMQDPADIGGFCKMCSKNTCAKCAGSGNCEPFEKKLLKMESRDRLLRAL